MNRTILAMSLLSFFGIANATDYSEGQVWAYKTRVGENTSTVLINRIEAHEKLGRIFHISVDGVRVRNPWRNRRCYRAANLELDLNARSCLTTPDAGGRTRLDGERGSTIERTLLSTLVAG